MGAATSPDAQGDRRGIVSGMGRLKPKPERAFPTGRSPTSTPAAGGGSDPRQGARTERARQVQPGRFRERRRPRAGAEAAAERGEEVPHRPRGLHYPATAVRAEIRHGPDPGDGLGGGRAAHRIRDPPHQRHRGIHRPASQVGRPVRRTTQRRERNPSGRRLGSGGREIDARADEFFAVFERAGAAVEAAVAVQRDLAAREWTDGLEVRLRFGIHSGHPTLTEAGYIGLAVHTTARICAAAHGGQIVVSAATRTAIGASPPAGVRFRGLGAIACLAFRTRRCSSRCRPLGCAPASRRRERRAAHRSAGRRPSVTPAPNVSLSCPAARLRQRGASGYGVAGRFSPPRLTERVPGEMARRSPVALAVTREQGAQPESQVQASAISRVESRSTDWSAAGSSLSIWRAPSRGLGAEPAGVAVVAAAAAPSAKEASRA